MLFGIIANVFYGIVYFKKKLCIRTFQEQAPIHGGESSDTKPRLDSE